jgi:ABC-2 type transport system ATP-binding protein
VRSVAESGSTVLLTTQHMEEADRLADRVAVIGQGMVLAEGTPAGLKANTGKDTLDEAFLALTRDAEGGAA